ncbi:Phosphorylase b kinase regulatory subunit alpha [Mortierella sp. AD011]|nr:Phosphorylase b kinase regulatory subunit alpha [Mortierella sp. AD011]
MVNTSCIESLDFLATKKDIDWLGILRVVADRCRGHNSRKLGLSKKQTQFATPGASGSRTPGDHRWSMRLRSLSVGLSFALLTAPAIDVELGNDTYFESHGRSHSSDHEEPRNNRKGGSAGLYSAFVSNLSQEAADTLIGNGILEGSAFPPGEEEEDDGSPDGSIVRQAAGLLNKVVNSLTINITDLVVRQKQVTIGSGPLEHFISNPLGPWALSKMIYDGNFDDVREGPVVQEVLLYLGSFIRADPAMFEGIMRLRTHFLIIALREEISCLNNCDETEAVEYLMQLSPFEVKSLLGTVLSGPTLSANATNMLLRNQSSGRISPIMSGCQPLNGASQADDGSDSSAFASGPTSLVAVPIPNMSKDSNTVTIKVQSGGYHSGSFSKTLINKRSPHRVNDTHISEDESDDLACLVDWLQPGMIVICSAKDDCFEHLTSAACLALRQLGSERMVDLKYRDSWCMIGEKGAEPGTAIEAHKALTDGPTPVLEKTVDLSQYKAKIGVQESFPSRSAIAAFVPNSSGRWLRRRKNDGALSRAPDKFYARVWHTLPRSAGFRIELHVLPRDPIISEKTPEEFNFALAVGSFLGVIRDPAERQIAVETSMVIAKIEDRLGMEVQLEVIDLPAGP